MSSPQESAATVEHVIRHELAKALGGVRGMLEAAVPTITFTVLFLTTRDLRLALTVSIVATVAVVVLRLLQRSTVQFALNALVGIGIAALFASRSGEAKDVFLPGILYNAGYAAVFAISILVGWPLLGFLVGSVTGDPTAWHQDKGIVRVCSRMTWLLALPCVVRVAVQLPLYLGDQVGLLGTSKIVLGWPLQVAAFAAIAWLLSRNATPLEERA